MKFAGEYVGLLVNFNVKKLIDGIEMFVFIATTEDTETSLPWRRPGFSAGIENFLIYLCALCGKKTSEAEQL